MTEVQYRSRYGETRRAQITDPEYDAEDLWEGVYYAARDAASGLPVTVMWDADGGYGHAGTWEEAHT